MKRSQRESDPGQQLFRWLNTLRKKQGLPPLSPAWLVRTKAFVEEALSAKEGLTEEERQAWETARRILLEVAQNLGLSIEAVRATLNYLEGKKRLPRHRAEVLHGLLEGPPQKVDPAELTQSVAWAIDRLKRLAGGRQRHRLKRILDLSQSQGSSPTPS
ncbi:MAG: hypothetical protein QXD60_01500 [Nanopusillaceae archaeon]